MADNHGLVELNDLLDDALLRLQALVHQALDDEGLQRAVVVLRQDAAGEEIRQDALGWRMRQP